MRGIPIEFEVEKAVNASRREITAYMSTVEVDKQNHRVMPTAFNNSLGRIAKGEIPVFRDHRVNIGTTLKGGPDSRGFIAVGYVSKTREGDETLEKAQDRSIRGCSFTGTALPNRWEVNLEKADDGTERTVTTFHEIKLREWGPCMDCFPVNERAEILTVKAFSDEEMNILYDLPHIVKALVLGRKSVSGEDERLAKAALRAYEAIGADADILKALLAPDTVTSPTVATPTPSTPADAEKSLDLTALLESLRRRGQIAA